MMLAVVKEAPEVGAIRVREVPRPRLAEGQVLVEVRASSICGSDLHIWHWDPIFHAVLHPPRVIGHELAGVVVERAPGAAAGPRDGDRVIAETTRYCGRCPRCRRGRPNACDAFQVRGVHIDGGLAEAAAVDAHLLHPIPDALSFEHAALVEPTSVAVHAVLARGGVRPGDLALVTGPGPIGLFTAQVARAAGAEVVMAGADVDEPARLPIAASLGVKTLNTQREPVTDGLQRLTGRPRADVGFECAGAPAAFQTLVDGIEKGGTIVVVALYSGPFPFDPSVAVRRELEIRASYASVWDDYERAIAFIADGTVRVEPLIARFPLAEAERAFQQALAREVMKPVLVAG
jgi:L-iditol 2-dehydrogenase